LNLNDDDVTLRASRPDLFGGSRRRQPDVNRDTALTTLRHQTPLRGLAGKVTSYTDARAIRLLARRRPENSRSGARASLEERGLGRDPGHRRRRPAGFRAAGPCRWFRFTTLGAGQPGSQLVLAPAFEAAQTRLLRGKDARFDPTPPADHGSVELDSKFALGSEAGDQVIMELDLSAYLDRRNDLTAIQQALLSLDTAVTLPELPTDTPATLTFVNNEIFFQAQPSGAESPELWKTDGTVLGQRCSSRDPPQHLTAGNTHSSPLGRRRHGAGSDG
jgi:hypothetical protein